VEKASESEHVNKCGGKNEMRPVVTKTKTCKKVRWKNVKMRPEVKK
jgi:hypothetical protein